MSKVHKEEKTIGSYQVQYFDYQHTYENLWYNKIMAYHFQVGNSVIYITARTFPGHSNQQKEVIETVIQSVK